MVRSDARENRERILAVARDLFDGGGDVPSMNQIAQRAQVGAGTLYRHFETRESLVLAVYQQEVERMVAAVPDLLARSSPLEALEEWTLRLVTGMRRKHGLGDALGASAHQSIAAQTYAPVIGAIETLLQAGRADGSIRGDADAGDFLQLTGALWRAESAPVDRAPRMLSLILDGLRVRPESGQRAT